MQRFYLQKSKIQIEMERHIRQCGDCSRMGGNGRYVLCPAAVKLYDDLRLNDEQDGEANPLNNSLSSNFRLA